MSFHPKFHNFELCETQRTYVMHLTETLKVAFVGIHVQESFIRKVLGKKKKLHSYSYNLSKINL